MPERQGPTYADMLWSPERPKSMRIAITGMGIIAPDANDIDTFWHNITNGYQALKPFDINELSTEKGFVGETRFTQNVKLAGRVELDPVEHLKKYNLKVAPKRFKERTAPEAQVVLCAMAEALSQSGILMTDGTVNRSIDPDDVAVRMGTILGPTLNISRYQNNIDNKGESDMYGIMQIDPQRLATITAKFFGFKGAPETSASACSAGGSALIGAVQDILCGDARMAAVGAADLSVHPHLITQLDNMRALAHEDDPKMARPFDVNYKGVFMGEGAAALFIETFESAEARHAKILAELTGYGKAGDGESDFDPTGYGVKKAYGLSLKRAGPQKSKGTQYHRAHAAGTSGDRTELDALREVNKLQDNQNKWAISSTKWYSGHRWGPEGLDGAIICVKALNEGILPPSLNLETPIAADVDFIPNFARKEKVARATTTAAGLGGGVTAFVFELPDD